MVQMDRDKSGKQVPEVEMDIGNFRKRLAELEMEVARILDSTFECGLESDTPIIQEDPFPDDDKSAEQVAQEKEMAAEEELFNSYRGYWQSSWGGSSKCGSFTDMTQVSPMYFTHLTPECIPEIAGAIASATLQIFNIKLAEIKGGLQWPLSLYGVVAVRGSVDHNRNLLFSCGRYIC